MSITVDGEHVHVWQLVTHLDGCHRWESLYSCECGKLRRAGGERSISDDPYSSAFWLLDSDCERCQDLLAGAEPKSWDEIE